MYSLKYLHRIYTEFTQRDIPTGESQRKKLGWGVGHFWERLEGQQAKVGLYHGYVVNSY